MIILVYGEIFWTLVIEALKSPKNGPNIVLNDFLNHIVFLGHFDQN